MSFVRKKKKKITRRVSCKKNRSESNSDDNNNNKTFRRRGGGGRGGRNLAGSPRADLAGSDAILRGATTITAAVHIITARAPRQLAKTRLAVGQNTTRVFFFFSLSNS